MYKNSLSKAIATLLIASCILACNTPKTNETVPENVIEEDKPLTIQQEQEQEIIGAAQLEYSDLDESGNGIYGRKMMGADFYEKLEVIKAEADPIHKGVLKIICCIDKSGNILMARPDVENTSMNDLPLQRKVGKILVEQSFEKTTAGPDRQCGLVIVNF